MTENQTCATCKDAQRRCKTCAAVEWKKVIENEQKKTNSARRG